MRYRIRLKLIIYAVLFAIIPTVILSSVYFRIIKNTEITSTAENVLYNAININKIIETNLYNIEKSQPNVISDSKLIDSIKTLEESGRTYKAYEASNYLNDYLFTNDSNRYLDAIYLFGKPMHQIYASSGSKRVFHEYEYSNSGWYKDIPLTVAETNKWILTEDLNNKYVISLFKQIREFGGTDDLGVVSFNIDESMLRKEIDAEKYIDSVFFIIDESGTIVSHPDRSLIDSEFTDASVITSRSGHEIIESDSGDILMVYVKSDHTGWTYVSQLILDEALGTIDLFRSYTFIIMIFIVGVMIIWNILTSKMLYNPVLKLVSSMKKFEKGDFGTRITDSRKDEVGYIYDRFNDMAHNIDELINNLYRQEILRQQAQLNAIESEINEHFLYNTLDSIRWMIRKGKNEEAREVIFKLSELFRISLDRGNEEISVIQIADMLKCYLDIMKHRLSKIDYEFAIGESIRDIRLLKYIFQPIVENSILHGTKNTRRNVKIKISFEAIGDMIRFSVWDDGSGISRERLDEIRAVLDSSIDNFKPKEFFALKNLDSQIKLFYGWKYGLSIESSENEWTEVSFSIPRVKKNENNGAEDDKNNSR